MEIVIKSMKFGVMIIVSLIISVYAEHEVRIRSTVSGNYRVVRIWGWS